MFPLLPKLTMTKLFISYAHEDEKTCVDLAQRLEALGFEVWTDAAIQGGDPFDEAIEQAILAVDAVLVLWSAYARDSDWVKDEIVIARNLKKRVIPISVDGTISTDKLSLVRKQTVNLHTLGMAATVDKLQTELSKRPPLPPSSLKSPSSSFFWPRSILILVLIVVFGAIWAIASLNGGAASSDGPTPTTPTATLATTSTSLPEITPIEATSVPVDGELALLEELDGWRVAQGYPHLVIDPTLQDIAGHWHSEISARPISQIGDVELDNQGQPITRVATINGYSTAVLLVVYAQPTPPSLADVLAQLTRKGGEQVHSQYTQAGFAASSDQITHYSYVVLVLGVGQ